MVSAPSIYGSVVLTISVGSASLRKKHIFFSLRLKESLGVKELINI